METLIGGAEESGGGGRGGVNAGQAEEVGALAEDGTGIDRKKAENDEEEEEDARNVLTSVSPFSAASFTTATTTTNTESSTFTDVSAPEADLEAYPALPTHSGAEHPRIGT